MPEYELDYSNPQTQDDDPKKEEDPRVMDIVVYPDQILRETAVSLEEDQFKGKGAKDLKKLVDRMFATLTHYDGLGLAAPQVGVSQRLFVTAVQPSNQEMQQAIEAESNRWKEENVTDPSQQKEFLKNVVDKKLAEGRQVFINPEILEQSGESVDRERCLSIPSICVTVKRPTKIKIRALDIQGQQFELEADGMFARCLMHELDHCNGRLITDYSTGMERTLNGPKLKRLERDFHRQNNQAEGPKPKQKVKKH